MAGTESVCPPDKKKIDKADVILLSHGHFDHTGDIVERRARDERARSLAVFELSLWLERKGLQNVTGMGIGGTVSVAGLEITMVPAVHTSSIVENDTTVYLGLAAGFVVKMENGQSFYFAGDTALFGDMRLIAELHAAGDRLPADRRSLHDGAGGGGAGGADARRPPGRADALRHLSDPDRHADQLKKLVDPDGIDVLVLKPGETAQ